MESVSRSLSGDMEKDDVRYGQVYIQILRMFEPMKHNKAIFEYIVRD